MMMTTLNNRLLKVLMIVTLMIFLAGCTSVAEVESSVDDIKLVPVLLDRMKKDTVEHTYVSIGEVVPSNQVDLFVSGNGYIEQVAVGIGDRVDKDMLVIALDEAEVDRSTYNATESQLRTVRENLRAQLSSTKETLLLQEELLAEGIVTKIEVDQISLQVESLQRQFTNAAVAYNTQLAAINDSLANSVKGRTIYSPIEGLVAGVYVKEGQGVANQLALSIIDDSRLYVKTFISSDLKKALDVGDEVRVVLDGDETLVQEGLIDSMNVLPDPVSKLFEVMVVVEDTSNYIVGDYAQVEFIIERYETVMLPTKALIRSGMNTYVYTYSDQALEKVLIETGRTKGQWIEVKDIKSLSDVVVRGQNQLTLDSQITIVEK